MRYNICMSDSGVKSGWSTYAAEEAAAVRMARMAGEVLRDRFFQSHQISFKGKVDLVTEADLASEALIREELACLFPGDAVLGEEAGGASSSQAGRVWVFDPLDGTTNYAHRLPIFSVSIALCRDGIPRAGAVYNPVSDELFRACEGGGAWCERGQQKSRLQVTTHETLEESLLVTGFPYRIRECVDDILEPLREMMLRSRGVRRLGSASLDLAWVAAGIFDAFWEVGLKPWDIAAGTVILREAGGVITDYAGGDLRLDAEEMVASNGRLHVDLVSILRRFHR